jgi:hypothetical protein
MDKIKKTLTEINKKYQYNIFIGIPCYGGNLNLGFVRSFIELRELFKECNVKSETRWMSGESLISRGRNSLFSEFIRKREYTHFLFIDVDITFSPVSIINLLLCDMELSGISYPKKNINWLKVEKYSNLIKKDINEFQNKITDMNFNPKYYKNDKGYYMNSIKNLIECKNIPTGMMLIQRVVADLLVFNYGNKEGFSYRNNIAGLGNHKMYDFFKTGVVDNIYLSEDYYFCKLCEDIGIQMFIDPNSTLVHTGNYDFVGCLKYSLQDDSLNRDSMMMLSK